ncbi:hypothetical protein GBAR_LOCUS6726 [Geodia barretti]|uniref:N-acetylglucosaminylphosphatidylinositol deacetylase n=1 Tax=Geodia barretti TaxID=519541 RepID=A0AA35RH13_GEOBA|nr:hypothetical protein GBAR_LOCUS6726 [Geodia barretti]
MAHPHDWTWVSGTLCLHARAGDRVTVCSVTHGGATHRERFLDEMAKPEADRDAGIVGEPVEAYTGRKEQEMRQAAALFGIDDVRVLGFDDKPFTRQEQPQAIDAIQALIVEVAADILITENPYGDSGFRMAHRTDHTEVGSATLEARDQRRHPARRASAPASRSPTSPASCSTPARSPAAWSCPRKSWSCASRPRRATARKNTTRSAPGGASRWNSPTSAA